MDERSIDILVILIGLPLFGMGLYLWIRAVRHMIGTLRNFKPNMTWGRFLPVFFFMPSLFNEQGNMHRQQLLKYSGLFIAYCTLPFLIHGLWKLIAS